MSGQDNLFFQANIWSEVKQILEKELPNSEARL